MTNSELQIYRLQLLALQNRLNTDVSDLVVKGWWRSSRGGQDPWFTFCFNDDRLMRRFHLVGVPAGQRVSVIKVDPSTGERLGLLATGTLARWRGGPGQADHREGWGCVHRRAGGLIHADDEDVCHPAL
jgi:hypothetical protein